MVLKRSDLAWRALRWTRTTVVSGSIAVFVGPILWFALQAFQPGTAAGTYTDWTWRLAWGNFAQLFGVTSTGDYTSAVVLGFPSALINSVAIGLITGMFAAALAVPAGYVIGLRRPSWQSIFGLFGLVGLPPVVVIVPVLSLIRNLGLHDTYAGLVIVHVALVLPVTIAVIAAQDIRRVAAQNEIAALDGLPITTRLYRVTLGALLPAVVAAGALAFLLSYTEFFFALILSASKVRTAPVVTAGFQTLRGVQWGLVAAAAMTLMTPCIGTLLAMGIMRRVRMALGVKA